MWSVIVVGACILCGVLVYPIYDKWQTTPTITSIEETNYPIWNIYFPAVSICSNNKVVESQIGTLMRLQPWKNLSKSNESFETYFRDAITTTVLFNNEPEELKNINNEVKNVLDTYKKYLSSVLQKVLLVIDMLVFQKLCT